MTTTTSNPGQTVPSTHPMSDRPADPSARLERQAWLASYCERSPGAVPARLEFRWFIEDDGMSTSVARVEGKSRLKALGDRHGFTPVWEEWSIVDGWLRVDALVAWWPVLPVDGPVHLVDEPAVAA